MHLRRSVLQPASYHKKVSDLLKKRTHKVVVVEPLVLSFLAKVYLHWMKIIEQGVPTKEKGAELVLLSFCIPLHSLLQRKISCFYCTVEIERPIHFTHEKEQMTFESSSVTKVQNWSFLCQVTVNLVVIDSRNGKRNKCKLIDKSFLERFLQQKIEFLSWKGSTGTRNRRWNPRIPAAWSWSKDFNLDCCMSSSNPARVIFV